MLETLKVHSKDVLMDEMTWIWMRLRLRHAGLVGSDLANMINEAAINAVKNTAVRLSAQKDLFEAFEDRVSRRQGEERPRR